jgi:hypothetical protein
VVGGVCVGTGTCTGANGTCTCTIGHWSGCTGSGTGGRGSGGRAASSTGGFGTTTCVPGGICTTGSPNCSTLTGGTCRCNNGVWSGSNCR